MKTFFSDLWNDPAKFTGAMRMFAFFIAGAIQTGLIPLPAAASGWVGTIIPILIQGGAMAVPAGQANKNPV